MKENEILDEILEILDEIRWIPIQLQSAIQNIKNVHQILSRNPCIGSKCFKLQYVPCKMCPNAAHMQHLTVINDDSKYLINHNYIKG